MAAPSSTRRRPALALAIAALAIAGGIAWWAHRHRGTHHRTDASATAHGADTAAPGTVEHDRIAADAAPTSGVRRLSTDERRRLGEQIAAARLARARARAAAASPSPAPAPDLTDVAIRLEDVGPDLQADLQAAIPLLASCYEDAHLASHDALATMTLVSDPDVGTVIDTERVTGPDGLPLPDAIDGCLRDAIDSLALPPLGNGGKLPLQYSFRFD